MGDSIFLVVCFNYCLINFIINKYSYPIFKKIQNNSALKLTQSAARQPPAFGGTSCAELAAAVLAHVYEWVQESV